MQSATPRIEVYQHGEIVIDGRTYRHDVIVFPDRVLSPWWRQEGHTLARADLWDVVQARPEIVVIGQGSMGRMVVPEEVRRWLEQQGIRVLVQPTPLAVKTYNALRERHRVIAALHLTC